MSLRKKIWLAIVILLISLCAWNYKMIVYGVKMGVGQGKILYNARPIEEVMEDKTFPDSLKKKLKLIQEIRDFAIDSLGINDSKNYKTVYDQKGKPILWVLTVCPKYTLEAYEWDYPFLGSMGYMGFFNEREALEEEKKYKDLGYDTDVGEVQAWSTLGWFSDPILSGMLDREEGQLARLIIHELTHSTLFVEDDVDFNENLATFVGDNGAYAFLEYKYGKGSKQYNDYKGYIKDIERYTNHILSGANSLDSLYISFDSIHQKEDAKWKLIEKIVTSADTINFYDRKPFNKLLQPEVLPNNTFFITYKMYRQDQNQLKDQFRQEFKSNFKSYLFYLKQKYS